MDENMLVSQFGIIEAMTLVGEFIWCTLGGFNTLLKININTKKAVYVCVIPGEEFQKERLYSDIQCYENKLILIPMAAKDIAIYNIYDGHFIKIKLKMQEEGKSLYKQNYKFSKCIIYKSYAYVFCVSYPAIIKINLKDYSVQYLNEWLKFFEGKDKDKTKVYFRNIYRVCNKVYLASCCCNLVMEFDIEREKFSMHRVGKTGDIFSDIVLCGDKVYISQLLKREILVLNKQNWCEIERIGLETKISTSIEMKTWKNKVYYFPVNMNSILIIESSNCIKELDLQDKGSIVYKVINKESNCYFITEKNFSMGKYSMENNKVKYVKIQINKDLKNAGLKKYILMNQIFNECYIDLQSWITLLEKNTKNCDKNKKNYLGEKIWKKI